MLSTTRYQFKNDQWLVSELKFFSVSIIIYLDNYCGTIKSLLARVSRVLNDQKFFLSFFKTTTKTCGFFYLCNEQNTI